MPRWPIGRKDTIKQRKEVCEVPDFLLCKTKKFLFKSGCQETSFVRVVCAGDAVSIEGAGDVWCSFLGFKGPRPRGSGLTPAHEPIVLMHNALRTCLMHFESAEPDPSQPLFCRTKLDPSHTLHQNLSFTDSRNQSEQNH